MHPVDRLAAIVKFYAPGGAYVKQMLQGKTLVFVLKYKNESGQWVEKVLGRTYQEALKEIEAWRTA